MPRWHSFSESMKINNKLWLSICWLAVLIIAVFLRFENLADRPFHFDEATGARITAQRMGPSADYQFNPVHNHGPTLSAAAAPICYLAGERSWNEMTKLSLRLVPALAGSLLVMCPILLRRRFGDIPVLAAAALLATSPLLVYYSRMFIHEMILTLCGLIVVVLLCAKPRYSQCLKWGLVGLFTGLMFATKESFAISVIAWAGAGGVLALLHHKEIRRLNRKQLWLDYRMPMAVGLIAAAFSSGLFYTDGLTNPKGAWEAVQTFFIYKTEPGHDKAFAYYFEMLAIPSKDTIWWFETPVLVFAVVAWLRTHLPNAERGTHTNIIRFLAYASVFHVLIYSMIAYKTPWLMCLPWAHVCLLAGLSLKGFSRWRRSVQVVVVILLTCVLVQQTRLTRFATGRFANDTRNPYTYVPTSRDVERLQLWLRELSLNSASGQLEPIAVVGSQYWPLPWYLRDFESIGYWLEVDSAIDQCPVVLAMPEVAEEVNGRLEETHFPLSRTLRSQVPVVLFLRNDHWDNWMAPESP